ncbi:MAG: hypothetical protein LBH81_03445 [Rickettsiales bacterium]|jgi:hypothetical protein|nr:hypothetical protein [Rickettsiales bacterium]
MNPLNDPYLRIIFLECGTMWTAIIGLIIYLSRDSKPNGSYYFDGSYERPRKSAKDSKSAEDSLPIFTHVTIETIEKMGLDEMLAVPEEHIKMLAKDMQTIFYRELHKLKYEAAKKKNR